MKKDIDIILDIFRAGPLPKNWIHLSFPKGKRKKRAHKKYMKKHGITRYLNDAARRIEKDFEAAGYHEKIFDSISEAAFISKSEIESLGKLT